MNTPETAVAAALSLAGILNASVMGINVETVFVATGFTMLGAMGRLGFEMAKAAEAAEGADGVKWSKVFSLLGGSLISAPTISVICLTILSLIGIQSDKATLLGLVFFGFIGPKSLLWLFNTGSNLFQKKTGLTLPGLPGSGDKP